MFFGRTPSRILRIVNICEVMDLFFRKPFWFFLSMLSILGSMQFRIGKHSRLKLWTLSRSQQKHIDNTSHSTMRSFHSCSLYMTLIDSSSFTCLNSQAQITLRACPFRTEPLCFIYTLKDSPKQVIYVFTVNSTPQNRHSTTYILCDLSEII